MANPKKLTAAFLALATSYAVGLPSNAQVNFSDIENLINSWGLSYGALAPNQSTVRANISARRSQLESQISSDLSSGRISSAEAYSLRSQLADVDARLNTDFYTGGGLTVGEVRDVLTSLRAVSGNLQTAIANGTGVIPGVGGIVVSNDLTSVRSNINSLRSRINSAMYNGRISRAQANQLLSSLNWISSQTNSFRRGGLTATESAQLNGYLATVSARFDTMNNIAVRPGRFDTRFNVTADLNKLRADINSGIRTRRLSYWEQRQLTSELNRINSLNSNYLASGRTMTRAEYNTLRSMISSLRNRLNGYM